MDEADLAEIAALPPRLSDGQLAKVEAIAALPVPALPPSSEQHFLRIMRTLTLLPARKEDDLSAELRLALYRRHFGHLSEPALSYLVERATLECRFFPTPAECKAILIGWVRRDPHAKVVAAARVRARQERERRFDLAMDRLKDREMSQSEADALPPSWRRIAMTRSLLRADGTVRPPFPCAVEG